MPKASVLLDTNIISELMRPRPDVGVLAWADRENECLLSAISVDELAFGLAWRPNQRIADFFAAFVALHTVLPVTEEIARRAGQLRGTFRSHGIARSQPDMLIAATAQVHALTLVTRNTGDFSGCGIPILNPFST
ncbi:MAG: type II toxin-antitoxin system VapC family toxin [Rhodocyclaceae bacterium]|nr:type II toxin-antitoxin system VapC family toxin [Rhodocyclaceae bacterium]MDZ4213771.1 type II toxin-antitoxin system VapC family toxin [Rhodocyclaceae bacterium]